MADLSEARDAQQHRGQREPLRRARHVGIALCPLRVAEAVLAGRKEQLREVQHELAVVHSELDGVLRQNLRPVEVELVRRRRDHQIGERVLPERLEALHVHAGELRGLRDLHDVAGKAECSQVESGRQRLAVDEPPVQSVANVNQQRRSDDEAVVEREAVY